MRNLLYLSLLLSASVSAWANVNLLEQIQAGNTKFAMTASCKNFLLKSNKYTFRNKTLYDSLETLDSLKLGPSYYHYTDDSVGEVAKAVASNDFKPIVTYLYNYDGALGNVFGGGLYLAANPFTSAKYGRKQVLVGLKPKTKVYNETRNGAVLLKELTALMTLHAPLLTCPMKLVQSIFVEESGADAVYYDSVNEWFVIFNEEVIESATMMPTEAKEEDKILKAMLEAGYFAQLKPFISDLGSKRRITVKGSALAKVTQDFSKVKSLDDANKEALVSLLPVTAYAQNSFIDAFVKQGFLTYAQLENGSTKNASNEFLLWLGGRIQNNPTIVSSWEDERYLQSTMALMKAGAYDVKKFFSQRKNPEFIKAFYESNLLSSDLMRADDRRWAVNQLFSNYVDLLLGLPGESVLVYMKDILDLGDRQKMGQFLTQLEKLKYPVASLNSAFFSDKSRLDPVRGSLFVQDYLLRKNFSEAEAASTIDILVNGDPVHLREFLKEFLKIRSGLANSSDWEGLAVAIIEKLKDQANDFINPAYSGLFPPERNALFKNIMTREKLSAADSRTLISKFTKMFGLSVSDLYEISGKNWDSFGVDQVTELVSVFETDPKTMGTFLDLSAKTPFFTVLKSPSQEAVAVALTNKYRTTIFLRPGLLPELSGTVAKAVYDIDQLSKVLSGYGASDQWNLVKKVMKTFPGEHARILAAMKFDNGNVKAIMSELNRMKIDRYTAEAFMNNPLFVKKMSLEDFSEFVRWRLSRLEEVLNLDGLFDGGALNTGGLSILLANLNEKHGPGNIQRVIEMLKVNLVKLEEFKAAVAANEYFLVKAFNSKDPVLVKQVFSHLTLNYPQEAPQALVANFVETYILMSKVPEAKTFMEKFLCKKVNDHRALKLLIKDETDYKKKYKYENYQDQYCR